MLDARGREANMQSETRKSNFACVPNWVFDVPNLRATDRLILATLYRYAYGNKTEARPSQKLLAIRLGCERETVRESLRRLLKAGIIHPLGSGGQGRKLAYDLPWDCPKLDDYAAMYVRPNMTARPPSNMTARPPRFAPKHDGAAAINKTMPKTEITQTLRFPIVSRQPDELASAEAPAPDTNGGHLNSASTAASASDALSNGTVRSASGANQIHLVDIGESVTDAEDSMSVLFAKWDAEISAGVAS